MKTKLFFIPALILYCSALNAQDNVTTFTAITDQDFVYSIDPSKNEDRNYTQGTAFSFSNPDYYNSWIFAPHRLINERISRDGKFKRVAYSSGVAITGTAFTPRIIDSAGPIIGDRPFAFLLAVTTTQFNQLVSQDGSVRNYESFSLTYGLLGTKLGYDFQGWAHVHLVQGRPADPKGWNTQISQGGVPTFLIGYERLRTVYIFKNNGLSADGFVSCGINAGYYNRVYTSTYLRFGWINHNDLSSWSQMGSSLSVTDKGTLEKGDSTLLASRDSAGAAALLKTTTKKFHWELFCFSKATANLMGRNALLLGQILTDRPDEYTLDPAWVKVGVLDIEIGLAGGVYWKDRKSRERFFKAFYKNTIRTPEFDSRIFPTRWHYFGSIGVQFSIGW